MNSFEEHRYKQEIPHNITAIIGADIGGTNSNFGIFDQHNATPDLLFSLHTKSQKITDFPSVIKQLLSYVKKKYNISIDHALFACAGVVSPHKDFSKPTNLDFIVDAYEIKKVTGLRCVYVVNDFEVIGYGIDLINPKDLVRINQGKSHSHTNKAILGAGTGLGKCMMFWNHYAGRYVPVASEGGHADAALQYPIEFELANFIKKTEHFNCTISWEDLLSGNGIQRIYQFFHANTDEYGHEEYEQLPHPDEIFKQRNHDKHSTNTYELYITLYARCAKNFALDALALGGIYIAGGIAAHNVSMFQSASFMKEFIDCGKQAHLLKEIPIYVITDYNVSLYGAAYYLYLEDVCPRE